MTSSSKGTAWVVGAFVFCPCHLPLTLAYGAALFSGTAIGALWSGHPYLAGAFVTVLWVAGTWRGFHYLKSAEAAACPIEQGPIRQERSAS